MIGGRPVGDNLARFDLLAELDDGLLVLAGPFVEAHELAHFVLIGADFDMPRVDAGHSASTLGADQHAGVQGGVDLHARADDGRLGYK